MELFARFLIGGLVVSAFALIGDTLKPRSFAGLFAAAPSVALATLGMALTSKGTSYAAQEVHSMMIGAVAFFIYLCATVWLIARWRLHAGLAAFSTLSVWFVAAIGGWLIFGR